MSSHPPKILVEILTDNLRSRNTIEFAIQRHGQGKISLGPTHNAHLAVVDCESAKIRDDLRRYHRRYPQRSVVLMLASVDDHDFLDGDLADLSFEVVVKPVKVDGLILAIRKCATRPAKPEPVRTSPRLAPDSPEPPNTESTLVIPGGFKSEIATVSVAPSLHSPQGSTTESKTSHPAQAGDINLSDPVAVERARFSAEGLLLGRLKSAIRQIGETDAALLAQIDATPLFRFLPHGDRVVLLTDPESLSELATRLISEGQFSLRPDHSQPSIPQGAIVLSCEALLWRLALLTYRGLIPDDTNPLDRVFLTHWPNMTRLDTVPDSLRIAALWSRMPVDLGYTARALGIPQKHVFLFYAAARSLGLVGPEQRASNFIFSPDPGQDVMTHTFLNHLAEYISGGRRIGGSSEKGQS
jgi:hypothetical protein